LIIFVSGDNSVVLAEMRDFRAIRYVGYLFLPQSFGGRAAKEDAKDLFDD